MFFIASTGRTGTFALANGLDEFSDHEVAHEPDPLLQEAWLKHRGLAYEGPRLSSRLALYARRHAAGDRYGESVRTASLMPELLAAVPGAPLLVIVRDPVGYVRSAHGKRVLRKGDEWDRYRLMPDGDRPEEPVAFRLARHWCVVNRYLLAAVERHRPAAVAIYQPLGPVVEQWARFLGVRSLDCRGLADFLANRPNRSPAVDDPEGLERVESACEEVWDWTRDLARRRAPDAPDGSPP